MSTLLKTNKAVIGLLALCLLAGCGQAAASTTHQTKAKASSTPSPLSSDNQPAATDAGLPPSGLFESVKLVPTPDPQDFGVPADSQWLDAVVNPGSVPETGIAEWAAHIQAVSDALVADRSGAPPVVGLTVSKRESDGTLSLVVAGRLDPAEAAKVEPSMSKDAAEAAIAATAENLGVTVKSISYLDTPGFDTAPIVLLQTSDPQAFLATDPYVAGDLGLDPQEPVLVEVIDGNSHPIELVGLIPGDGIDISWHDPSYGCIGSCPPEGSD